MYNTKIRKQFESETNWTIFFVKSGKQKSWKIEFWFFKGGGGDVGNLI